MYDESHALMKLIRVAGRQHEAGDDTAALGVYREVWRLAEETGDDFHGCMTAHMIGVMEPEINDKLYWHLASLERAQRIADGKADGFYPSLYLSVGSAYRHLGHTAEALTYYRFAEQHLGILNDDAYGRAIREWTLTALRELSGEPAETSE